MTDTRELLALTPYLSMRQMVDWSRPWQWVATVVLKVLVKKAEQEGT